MNNNAFFILLSFFACNFFASTLSAETASLAILPYDQANVIYKEQKKTLSYRLALGPYEKKGNRWIPEEFRRLKGELSSETHELPRGFDEQEAFDIYRAQLLGNIKILYECERRDCGESNNWANDHFRIKQLYGLDQYQFYGVYQIDETQFVSLYSVRRGNRRVYVQIDIITTANN